MEPRSRSTSHVHGIKPGRGGGSDDCVGIAEAAEVALATGEADAVEVFADGDGVLAGGAEQVAELGHGDRGAVGESFADLAAEFGVGVGVEVEAGVDLGDPMLVAEQGEQVGDDGGRRAPADAASSAASGGVMPPARIASASSCLSRRSPWLSFASWPRRATVRASATTGPGS